MLKVRREGVKVCSIYQPGLEYSGLQLAPSKEQETDEHGPDYIRDYAGYLALHCADTAQPVIIINKLIN